MAAIRIRGTWILSLTTHSGKPKIRGSQGSDARLVVQAATRAGLSGELQIGKIRVPVQGKVKPGSPAVVTLFEVTAEQKARTDGLEAALYIPPWWPTVDYDYDLITGTMVVGSASALRNKELRGKLILVTGILPFE